MRLTRQRLTSLCVILLVAAVSLDHRPIPHALDTVVALAGAALAGALAVHAGRRTRILYLAAGLLGIALALSSLPVREEFPVVGVIRAFYLPALVLVVISAVLAWPELRAALSQDRERIRTAAVENHRAHVSRELHDETLQALVHLRRSLEHALDDPAPDALRHAATEGAALAAEQITALRDIIADLHPSVLTELGLDAALETLVDRTSRRHPRVTITYQGTDAETDTATALTTYRITQEALTNAVKHSGATRIDVELVQRGAELAVRVHDNGTMLSGEGGLGIPAMHARAALHQGQVLIESGSHGTVVTAHLRCGQPADFPAEHPQSLASSGPPSAR